MSDIDLTAAAEAARAGVADRLSWASLHWGVEDVSTDAWPHVATAAVAAAAPLIEAAVREKVAAEIEAGRAALKQRYGDQPEDMYIRGCLYGSSVAAGIAKNGPRP